MQVDISFHPKDHMAFLKFDTEHFTTEMATKECLAIVTVFSADFYLDPELGAEDIQGFIAAAKDKSKKYLIFELSEEGLELELS